MNKSIDDKKRAWHLDEAPEEPLAPWVYRVLKKGEKAYLIKAPEGLIAVCLSDDPSRDGRNLAVLG
jgi:hypothetical protein